VTREEAFKLSDEDRQALEEMILHPGWAVFVGKIAGRFMHDNWLAIMADATPITPEKFYELRGHTTGAAALIRMVVGLFEKSQAPTIEPTVPYFPSTLDHHPRFRSQRAKRTAHAGGPPAS